jgi:hypothetical protein
MKVHFPDSEDAKPILDETDLSIERLGQPTAFIIVQTAEVAQKSRAFGRHTILSAEGAHRVPLVIETNIEGSAIRRLIDDSATDWITPPLDLHIRQLTKRLAESRVTHAETG